MIGLLTKREWDPQHKLWALNLDLFLYAKNPYNHLLRLVVNSGSPGRQNFRTLADQHIGELEPVPEGVYQPGPLEAASGNLKDYFRRFPEIDSPIWQVIYRARAIGFHLDGNRAWAPGSAGCVVFRSLADCRSYTELFLADPFRLKELYVDWGLGSIVNPFEAIMPKDSLKRPMDL